MKLHDACEKLIKKSADERQLERFVLSILEGETPAMALAIALDESENDHSINIAPVDADAWSREYKILTE